MSEITICIPTYNRASKLESTLSSLLPLCDQRVEIFICDNHSTDNTLEIIIKNQNLYTQKGITLSFDRNPCNFGFSMNLFLAFNAAKTKWVLMLGDDDIVNSRGLEFVLSSINAYPNSSFLHFDGNISEKTARKCINADEFIFGYHSHANSFWMSTYAFNKNNCSSALSWCLPFGMSSYAPHLMIALASISSEHPCYILPTTIVSMNRAPGQKWAASPVILGLRSILDSNIKISKEAYNKLRNDLFKHSPKPSAIWHEINSSTSLLERFQKRRWLHSIFISWLRPISSNPKLFTAWVAVLCLNESIAGRKILQRRALIYSKSANHPPPETNIFSRL